MGQMESAGRKGAKQPGARYVDKGRIVSTYQLA